MKRCRNAAISPRVTVSEGEKVACVVPLVMPSPAAQATASFANESAPTSSNGCCLAGVGCPAARQSKVTNWARVSGSDGENVSGLVIGWPVNMDGSEGPRCDATRDFAHALLRMRDLPIAFQDERLSTQAVESAMLAADMTRARRAERRDALAAAWILQSALDRLDAAVEDSDRA